MKPIEKELNFSGHWLRQIWRKGDVAVYERSIKRERPAHELEMIVIRVEPERVLPSGSVVLEHEAYPSSGKWGTLAWSFPIRHKDWVLGLAQKVSEISNSRPSFVRKQISAFRRLNGF